MASGILRRRCFLLLFLALLVLFPGFLWAGLESALAAGAASATQKADVFVVYEPNSSLTDNGFTASAHEGAKIAAEQFGIRFEDVMIPSLEEAEAFYRGLAERKPKLIIGVGIKHLKPALAMADLYPDIKFTVIDGIIPPLYPNAQSVMFKDHEGAFLVGVAAGLATTHEAVGFVGGMDVPLIRNFAHGFAQGVQHANPRARVISQMVGTTQKAWNDPVTASHLTELAVDQGVDVIFAAAGGSGLGVLKTAAEKGILSIGVDANQNHLYPGKVLTSMIKRVDLAVFDAIRSLHEESWEPGIKYLGVADGYLDFAVDEHNSRVFTDRIRREVQSAKEQIRRGQLKVEPYSPR